MEHKNKYPRVQSLSCFLFMFVNMVTLNHAAVYLPPPPFLPLDNSYQPEVYALDTLHNITHPKWLDVRDVILTEYVDTCGNSRLCNVTGFESSLGQESCNPCDECFCDDVCFQYGDCCLDRVIDDVLANQYVSETSLNTENTLAQCMDLRFKATTRTILLPKLMQRLFTKCPLSYDDHNIKDKCHKSGDINQYLLHSNATIPDMLTNWPVVSRKTTRSYKNRACATCHGDSEDLISWNLEISCSNSSPASSFSSPQEMLQTVLERNDCQLAFITPEPFPLRKCQLWDKSTQSNDGRIRVCNATGERVTYDLLLWKTCETYSQPYVIKSDEVYGNMFCYFCQIDWKKFGGIPGCGAGVGFPFILVFSPDALQQVQDSQSDRECSCPSEYVYDTYKKICRKLTCANGKVVSDNKCVSKIKSSFGFAYSMSLQLETTLYSESRLFPSSDNEFKTIATNIRHFFEDKVFGEYKTQANIPQFIVQTFVTSIHGNMSISIDVFCKVKSNYNILPSEFENRLLTLNSTDWNVEIPGNGNVTFQSKLVPELPIIDLTTQNEVRRVLIGEPEDGKMREYCIIDVPGVATFSPWTMIPQIMEYTEVKNTLNCARFVFNLTEDVDVTLITNDTRPETGPELVHEPSGVRLSFLDISIIDSDIVLACAEEIVKEMEKMSQENSDVDAIDIFGAGLVVTSHVCLSISAVTLLLTFLTYCIFPSLRTLPGKCTMALVFTLFVAIVLFQVGGAFTEVTTACQTVGVITHFFLLSSFVWMVICTFHMYRVFAHLMDHVSDDENHYLRLFCYAVISIIVPSLVVATTIITNHVINTNNSDDNRKAAVNVTDTHSNNQFTLPRRSCEEVTRSTIGYGDGVCYVSNKYSLVFASALPIILLCVANLAMFVMTLCSLRKMTSQQKMVKKDAQSNIFIYVKLSSLTGINWIPCTIAAFVSSPVVWYIFLILTGLQGVYVFVSFVLNKRVLKMYQQLFRKRTTSLDAKTTTSQDPNRNHPYQVRHENGNTHSDDVKTLSTDSGGGMSTDPDATKQNGRAETAIET